MKVIRCPHSAVNAHSFINSATLKQQHAVLFNTTLFYLLLLSSLDHTLTHSLIHILSHSPSFHDADILHHLNHHGMRPGKPDHCNPSSSSDASIRRHTSFERRLQHPALSRGPKVLRARQRRLFCQRLGYCMIATVWAPNALLNIP